MAHFKPWLRSVEALYEYARLGIWLHTAWVPDEILTRLPEARARMSDSRGYVVVHQPDTFMALGVTLGCWTRERADHARALFEARELLDLMTDDPGIILGG